MVGQAIDNRYEVAEKIDQGGMGAVYRCVDLRMGREVAIKVLKSELAWDREFFERFQDEARILASFNHPNVAVVHDFIATDEGLFLVMEFVPGRNLQWLIRHGGEMSASVAIPLFCGVLDGIQCVHERDIIHRDIKPANIVLTPEGWPKVTDFGIARLLGGRGLTSAGRIFGTPGYMSPEQVRSGAVDHRSDIYSLGVVLFEMLTALRPFERDTDFGTMEAHLREPPPRLPDKAGDVTSQVEKVIHRALSKAPEERFQTVAEFRQVVAECAHADAFRNSTVRDYVRAVGERVGPGAWPSPSSKPSIGGSSRRPITKTPNKLKRAEVRVVDPEATVIAGGRTPAPLRPKTGVPDWRKIAVVVASLVAVAALCLWAVVTIMTQPEEPGQVLSGGQQSAPKSSDPVPPPSVEQSTTATAPADSPAQSPAESAPALVQTGVPSAQPRREPSPGGGKVGEAGRTTPPPVASSAPRKTASAGNAPAVTDKDSEEKLRQMKREAALKALEK